MGCSLWSHKELDTAEYAHTLFYVNFATGFTSLLFQATEWQSRFLQSEVIFLSHL